MTRVIQGSWVAGKRPELSQKNWGGCDSSPGNLTPNFVHDIVRVC